MSKEALQPLDFLYKTEPYQHQHEVFLRSRDEEDFAYLMEMGTGKTKVTLDVAAWLFQHGRIDFLLVIAPNGVHENWIEKEVPAHVPDWTKWIAAAWRSSLRKAEEKQVEKVVFCTDQERLKILAMNIDAFGVPEKYYVAKAKKLVMRLLRNYRVMMVIDESSKIKTPGAKRTRRLITLGRHAAYRRILTGTPVTNGPLDAYSQFRFLGDEYLGYTNFYSFKHRYAEWEQERNFRTGQQYEVLKGYANLEELIENISRVSYRVTKDECLDLPPKVYARRKVYLEDKQRTMYNKLRKDSLLELQAGSEITVTNVLTKMLRLQQLASGFVPNDEDEPATPLWDDPMQNPRMKELAATIEEMGGCKVIIWARFRLEIKYIAEMLQKLYGNEYGHDCVEMYYGDVSAEDRKRTRWRILNDPNCRFLVGNAHSGGYGLDFTSAPTAVYYTNDFSLEARLQSEDRIHRIGQEGDQCLYVDLEAHDTVDGKVIQALREKKKLADVITRDQVKEWL